MAEFEYYAFQGSTLIWADLGKPYKINYFRYQIMKRSGYITCEVPEGTSMEGIILKCIIDSGAHVKSWRCAKALKDHCNITINFEEIENDLG